MRDQQLRFVVREHLLQLQQSYGLSSRELRRILTPPPWPRSVPLSIFRRELGIMEAVIQYLIDHERYTPAQLAGLLGRAETTIRNAYAAGKRKATITIQGQSPRIPIKIFTTGDAPLTALTRHLRERGWRFVEIARALQRDPRNINSAYRRKR